MLGTSGNRAVDMLITYRVLRILTTPFEKQDAFKYGIIDKTGKVLRKYSTLRKSEEQKSYTWLHRFCFNVKRIMGKVGFGGRLGSVALALAVLLKEHNTKSDLMNKAHDGVMVEPSEQILQEIKECEERLVNKGVFDYPNLKNYKDVLESAVVQYFKMQGEWDKMLTEDNSLPPIVEHREEELKKQSNISVYGTYFGHDVLLNEDNYELLCMKDQDNLRRMVYTGDDYYEVI